MFVCMGQLDQRRAVGSWQWPRIARNRVFPRRTANKIFNISVEIAKDFLKFFIQPEVYAARCGSASHHGSFLAIEGFSAHI
jgi:hypothetical protein